ncbi:ABC transporter permease [Piscinibacter gummiphilus]|uniref:ABC transporter permease n=1 Tax=Piscinibacter gummiphilus TaxID=946333 RepID=A0ABZ0CP01_9BURK|nr:ABC transporter permease [Piscinibacter gummiphilus]WOB06246.1 ABC transporter permease [Piscinibacter gummiphilus]
MNAARLHRSAIALGGFAALAGAFFLLIGRGPIDMLVAIAQASVGSGYAVGESLLRATPILLCALATLVPARLGLVSVGAEGQLYFGALAGTGAMLLAPSSLSLVLLGGVIGGAVWALVPALLRVVADVNETISTLMLNYVAALLVTWLVYGPWKNPQSQGWPASIDFTEAARLPLLGESRVHVGLLVALVLGIALHLLFTRSRWGLVLDVLRSNPRLAPLAGLSVTRQVLLTMVIGGALAGLAGIAETSSVQGRLQASFANGAGLSGFLVAWLAGNRVLPAMALALLVGGLLAAGDGLQMMTSVPSSAVLVVQGLMFVAMLGAGAWKKGGAGG